jgi:hypothetical protein
VLTVGSVLYLTALPLSWFAYREHKRRDEAALAAATGVSSQMPAGSETSATPLAPDLHDDGERPNRLN